MSDFDAFFIRSDARSLFAVYQPPPGGLPPRAGVTLLYPVGDEYVRFHRAIRQLAIRLNRAGFGVLRVDYFGTGDSSGDLTDARMADWIADVRAAVAATRERAGTQDVIGFGLRLGASLLALAAADASLALSGAVLWDPVVNGAAYLRELDTLHADMLAYSHVIPRPEAADAGITEIVGFPFTDALLDDIRGVDLLATERAPAERILTIESNPDASLATLVERYRSLGADVDARDIPLPDFWRWMEDYGKVVVPNEIIQPAVDWVSGACA